MTRFLCAADLHLGSGADLGRTPTERLAEQEQVWASIIDIAVEEHVDALLFAGDAFEGPLPTPDHYVAFARPLARLSEAGIPIIAISGNGRHDSATRIPNALEVLNAGYANGLLNLYTTPGVASVGDVSIACLPWTSVARLVAAHGGGDRDRLNEQAAELLLATARGLREKIDGPAILMPHWSIQGASLPNGLPIDMAREPILPIADLEALGFDAIVAGHIHKHQELDHLGLARRRPIFYTGSPMALNFGECRDPHGIVMLDVDGADVAWRFHELPGRRLMVIDPTDASDWSDVRGAIIKGRYRATADQAKRIDHVKIREALYAAGAHKVVRIIADIEREDRARVEGLDESLDEMGALELFLESQQINGAVGEAMRERTLEYLAAARGEVRDEVLA